MDNLLTAQKGSRAWPARKDDAKIGLRWDWGEIFTDGKTGKKYRNVVLQANENADSIAVKKTCRTYGSHAKLTTIAIPASELSRRHGAVDHETQYQ